MPASQTTIDILYEQFKRSRRFLKNVTEQNYIRCGGDVFLAHQFHLNPELLEEKVRGQAAARGIPYENLVSRLARWAPSLPTLLLTA